LGGGKVETGKEGGGVNSCFQIDVGGLFLGGKRNPPIKSGKESGGG